METKIKISSLLKINIELQELLQDQKFEFKTKIFDIERNPEILKKLQ